MQLNLVRLNCLKPSALNKNALHNIIVGAHSRRRHFFEGLGTTMIGRMLDQLCNGLRVLLGTLIALLAIPVGMQVLARYTGVIPVYLWTEELATFIFVWTVMIGAMIAVWDGSHFDVRVLPDAKNPLLTLLQNGFVLVMILAFALIFAWYGLEYAKFGYIQHSVMMRANMLITYISLPITGVVWFLFAGYRLFEAIQIYKNRAVTAA